MHRISSVIIVCLSVLQSAGAFADNTMPCTNVQRDSGRVRSDVQASVERWRNAVLYGPADLPAIFDLSATLVAEANVPNGGHVSASLSGVRDVVHWTLQFPFRGDSGFGWDTPPTISLMCGKAKAVGALSYSVPSYMPGAPGMYPMTVVHINYEFDYEKRDDQWIIVHAEFVKARPLEGIPQRGRRGR